MTADSAPKTDEPKVFVSYVREDQDVVDRLAMELSAYGIKVWLDKTELKPGYRWKDAIRKAISEGEFFIACFSEAYQRRSKSYMNEELTLAIEELRQRPTDRAWFIPVLLSECEVPAMGIGAGETLRDIQWVELHRNWEEGITRIAAAIDPDAQIAPPPRVWQLNDHEWSGLIHNLSSRDGVVPILGRGVNYGVVPADEVLARKWARELEKPEWMGLPFSQVAEHVAQRYCYSDLTKILAKEYARARFSEVNAPGEPHAVLSRLPCEVFITACIDSFMEDALTSRGKKPRSAIVDVGNFRGHSMSISEDEFDPTVSEPLVVHLFGRLDVPESLVVTAGKQMRLLGSGGATLPIAARHSLGRLPLMWLGFDSETIEQRIVSSLVAADRRPQYYQHLFDREFEMEARRQGRQRIPLREFMAELQSRWEQENREDRSS